MFFRLRSVRQDAVIQRLDIIDPKSQIRILQGWVKFYFYAAFETKKNSYNNSDLHINNTHLRDCLRSLLDLYFANNAFSSKTENFDCYFVTGAYVLLNIQSTELLQYVFKAYPNLLRTKTCLRDAVIICLTYYNRNYIRFNRLIMDLVKKHAYVLLFALHTWIDDMRIDVVKMLCHSHNSKATIFNVNDLCKWLLLPSSDDVFKYCENLGLSIRDDGVKLMKSSLPISYEATQVSKCPVLAVLNKLKDNTLSDFLLT